MSCDAISRYASAVVDKMIWSTWLLLTLRQDRRGELTFDSHLSTPRLRPFHLLFPVPLFFIPVPRLIHSLCASLITFIFAACPFSKLRLCPFDPYSEHITPRLVMSCLCALLCYSLPFILSTRLFTNFDILGFGTSCDLLKEMDHGTNAVSSCHPTCQALWFLYLDLLFWFELQSLI